MPNELPEKPIAFPALRQRLQALGLSELEANECCRAANTDLAAARGDPLAPGLPWAPQGPQAAAEADKAALAAIVDRWSQERLCG